MSKENLRERLGYVEEQVSGGKPRTSKIVRGDMVFELVIGGPDRVAGYAKNGVAYECVYGGPDRFIGKVKYRWPYIKYLNTLFLLYL